jgi:hypothetical protein
LRIAREREEEEEREEFEKLKDMAEDKKDEESQIKKVTHNNVFMVTPMGRLFVELLLSLIRMELKRREVKLSKIQSKLKNF